MKKHFSVPSLILALAVTFAASAADIKGLYRIDFPVTDEMRKSWNLPGIAIWDQRIEINDKTIRYYLVGDQPLILSYKIAGEFIIAEYNDAEGVHYFPFYISPNGDIYSEGKAFKRKPNKAPEVTPMLVTPAANAPVAPSTGAPHL